MKKSNNNSTLKPTQAARGRKPMDAALHYLTYRARTVREMECYLDEQQYAEYEVQQVVTRLQELGYLNDAAFADEFIRTRLAAKPVSRRKLQEQLRGHALPRDVIEQSLGAISDEQEQLHALQVAKKYAAQLAELPLAERHERLLRRVLGRGFSSEDVLQATKQALFEESEDA